MTYRAHIVSGLTIPLFLFNPGKYPLLYGAFGVGAVFPDLMDSVLSLGFRSLWGRLHRKLSHWWVLYSIPVVLFLFGVDMGYIGYLVFYFCLGCLLHLFLDMFTKSGIPFLNPFNRSRDVTISFRLIRTGEVLKEFGIIFLLCLVLWFLLGLKVDLGGIWYGYI